MLSPICTRNLFESRGLPSPCKCPKCQKVEKREESAKNSEKESSIMVGVMASNREGEE
jgi:hypothetical protein